MDKCIMTADDVVRLFEWRDRNLDLVRRSVCPIKGIEIIIEKDNRQQSIKCVRDKEKNELVIIHSFKDGYRCKYKLKLLENNYFRTVSIKNNVNDLEFAQRFLEDVAGLYFALMALMAYGDDVEYSEEELNALDKVAEEKLNNRGIYTHTQKRTHKKSQPSVTYLLSRGTGNSVSVKAKGKHSSPRGEFSVRGHFRHYKNGNVVWIEEFKKGTGKKKDKVYKL